MKWRRMSFSIKIPLNSKPKRTLTRKGMRALTLRVKMVESLKISTNKSSHSLQ